MASSFPIRIRANEGLAGMRPGKERHGVVRGSMRVENELPLLQNHPSCNLDLYISTFNYCDRQSLYFSDAFYTRHISKFKASLVIDIFDFALN